MIKVTFAAYHYGSLKVVVKCLRCFFCTDWDTGDLRLGYCKCRCGALYSRANIMSHPTVIKELEKGPPPHFNDDGYTLQKHRDRVKLDNSYSPNWDVEDIVLGEEKPIGMVITKDLNEC